MLDSRARLDPASLLHTIREAQSALAAVNASDSANAPSSESLERFLKRFCEEGLESALNERPRPGQKHKLDERAEAHLVAIACSDPPEGHAHWTLKLLADKVVELDLTDSIARETVRLTLKKRTEGHGRRKSGAYLR